MKENIDNYMKMLLIGQKIEVLTIALNLKVFNFLEESKHTFSSLSSILKTDEYNTKILLDSLILLDLIYKEEEIYKNEIVSKKFFVYGNIDYCGDLYLHRKEMLDYGKKMLPQLVKNGNFIYKDLNHNEKWANAAKKYLKQEQKNFISKVAVDIVKNLKEFNNLKKMLDLGCSSGIVGLDIVNSHPNMEGVLFDYKEVTDVVNKHIEEYQLENRVKTLNGNIELDDIGKGYDLIWCSNIFYFFEDKKKTIKKIYDSLNPNGVLISIHVEIDETNKLCEDSFFYFLFLSMQKRNIFKPLELSDIFEDVGFRSINSYQTNDMPMTSSQVHIVKK